ncbi:MAG TPA: hypothetical protein VLB50_01710 [Ignavibacteriaceae bacterium]|nr:hypothetical protein [Ignavibacteriaceae bacterium]
MKKYLKFGIVLGLMLIFIKPVAAQDHGFGMGIILGEPTGLSAKLWTTDDNAFDFAAAWSIRGEGNLLLQADYVWHFFNLIPVSSGKLPLYIGIGGRVVLANDAQLGVRIPFGMDYLFATAPVDIFVELVPILDLSPATDFGVGGGIGIRYWFN